MHVTRSALEDLPTDDEGLQQVNRHTVLWKRYLSLFTRNYGFSCTRRYMLYTHRVATVSLVPSCLTSCTLCGISLHIVTRQYSWNSGLGRADLLHHPLSVWVTFALFVGGIGSGAVRFSQKKKRASKTFTRARELSTKTAMVLMMTKLGEAACWPWPFSLRFFLPWFSMAGQCLGGTPRPLAVSAPLSRRSVGLIRLSCDGLDFRLAI